jgi:acyl-homoserine lactone acylase PvdQ
MSKHYKDQFEMYNNGVYRKQMMNEQEIKNLKRKLVLVNK